MFVVTVSAGQDVLATIDRECQDRGVTDAAIVSLIGAVQGMKISVMDKDDDEIDLMQVFPEPLEITGTGEIFDGKAHIHVVAGGQNGTYAGHLHEATVYTFFVRAYIEPIATGGRALPQSRI